MTLRRVARWSSGVLLAAVVVAPLAAGVGARVWERWRPLAHSSTWQRPGTDAFVGVGLLLASALWLWFVVAVAVEVAATVRHGVARGSAPTGLLRSWVQFVLISGAVVAAPGVAGAAGPGNSVSADPPALVSYVSGMVTAFLISAGALGALEARRRRRCESTVGGVEALPVPEPAKRHIEVEMRRALVSSPIEVVGRAFSTAAQALRGDGYSAGDRVVVAVRVSPEADAVELVLSGPISAPRAWQPLGDQRWSLPVADLNPDPVGVDPSPCVVQLGSDEAGGAWFVDLEAMGLFRVCSPFADDVLRSMAASLALAPAMAAATLVTVGLDEVDLDGLVEGAMGSVHVQRAESLAEAVSITRTTVGPMMPAIRHATTQQLRARSTGERFEPTVVIASGAAADPSLVVRAASGVAIVVSVGEGVTPAGWGVWFHDGRHVLSPLGVSITPLAVGHHDVDDVVALLHEPIQPAVEPLPVVVISDVWNEPEWVLMVRLFGKVDVVDREGASAVFERLKALELVVWLSVHRGQSTRSSARTALWEMEVRAATFANVVSDARRGLGRLVLPPADDEWIGRTLTEDLPLHSLVVTDADLLRARVKAARTREGRDAIELLRPGLELVRGTPLLDTGFLWSDAEGHMSSLVMLATAAAVELATLYLDEGDADGVFWATGKGLAVLPGHEELIALRMRALAQQGDRAGVRHEWESYLRGLAADSWSSNEPAPKLQMLSAELLA